MKFFKSTILAMLGMAVALTSCSDDDDYTAGAKVPGAFFPEGTATTLSISPTATSFEVEVFRTDDAPLTFNVTATDESKLFSVPATVTFDEGKTVTTLTIGYDPAKLELGQPYELTLTVGDALLVGRNSVNLSVTMEDPMVVTKYEEGTGNYTYNNIWSGVDPGLPITISYKPATPNNVVWTISGWGYGVDFQITCEDMTKTDEYGDIPISVPCQYTGLTDSNYGPVYVADMYTYCIEILGSPATAARFEGLSYYTKETGTFCPYLIYYIPEYEDGSSYVGDYGYEIFQLDGYPMYGVEVNYDGLFTDRNGNMSARATANCEADVATLKAVMVEGTDAQLGINAILTGEDGVQEYTGAESVALSFPVKKGGDYTIVAVSFDANGEAQLYDYDSFTIQLGVNEDDANWEDWGQADMADGWIMAAFSLNGVPIDVTDYMFSVPVQTYVGDEAPENTRVVRLVEPYGDTFPLASNNAYPAKRNIEIRIEKEKYIGILPQESGFGTSSWKGQLVICNYEGYLVDGTDNTFERAFNVLTQNGKETTSFEDNTITVPIPMFGAPGIGDGEVGYTWQNMQDAIIVLPDAPDAVRAKVKAARVAAPKFRGVASGKAVKAVDKSARILPRQFNGKPSIVTLRVR